MPNFIWTRNPQEAYQNPYEYEAQDQFSRESILILCEFKAILEHDNRKYSKEDRSIEKAIWMLHVDAVDSLIECHELLSKKRHKIAGRIFRDTWEVLNLANLFHSDSIESNKYLKKWYDDEIIPNRHFRNHIKTTRGEKKSMELSSFYAMLSKFNHRSYRTLAYGYIRGKNDKFVYDGFYKSDLLVYPGVISMYYAFLAHFILIVAEELEKIASISQDKINMIFIEHYEKTEVLRKFREQRI